jgi:predicted Fe-S protein YdhL (DUF1289 family)
VTPSRPDAAPPGVASPCVNVCVIDERSGWCRGCLRTLDEIAAWGTMSDDDRRAIWRRLRTRRVAEGDPVAPPRR